MNDEPVLVRRLFTGRGGLDQPPGSGCRSTGGARPARRRSIATPSVPAILSIALLTGCVTYQGSENWRRGTCTELVDADERARCEEEATRPEGEYREAVEEALENRAAGSNGDRRAPRAELPFESSARDVARSASTAG